MIDHRKLGRELDLFDSDPLIGAGLPFWLPAGAAARYEVESYIREAERRAGYQHVYSPPLAKKELYQRSGHLDHFRDEMFPPMALSGDDEMMLRPSLCPHHALIFKSRPRSYRDLPLRIAEIGGMYRAERSGVLGGLARVRAISLNDAHNFCALDDVGDEVGSVLGLIRRAHADLGVGPARFRLSLRGEHRAGSDEVWDRAEELLRKALAEAGIEFVEAPGEAAFYGPKIDVQVSDPLGREWSLSTIQIDFHQPERFDLSYADRGGAQVRPVMVHRSVVGSLERLFAHLIEVHQGAFPVWYAPVQVAIVPVADEFDAAARALRRRLIDAGLRADVSSDGSMGARIRQASMRKVPYVAVIGAREAAGGSVSLRLRDGRQIHELPVGDMVDLVRRIADSRSGELG
jgi:threonyl-tRNA synthetase